MLKYKYIYAIIIAKVKGKNILVFLMGVTDMYDLYSDKVFEFTNMFTDITEWIGNIRIVQIGETCLDKGASVAEHIQVCHEITLIVSGTGVLTADREKNKCHAGDIQIVSKGIKHSIVSDDDSRLRYIHFAFDFNEYNPKLLSEFYGQCKNVLLHDDGNISWILNMLVNEYANNADFTDIMKESLVRAALVLIWRRVNSQTSAYRPIISDSPIGSTVYNIIKYIDNNINEKLTVSSIAKKFSYSDEYISRLFKEKTGVSVKKYILATKMKYAQSLLAEKKCSVMEITELMGYSSIQAFCKAFKKHTGYTPGQFDKEMKLKN